MKALDYPIAFATDRYSTDLATLRVGAQSLALIDVATGQVHPVPGSETARQLNPQWSPDGSNLYFLSDPDGITNVYQLHLATGQLFRLTNLYTGVSGITETSPALTVAQRSGRLLYSVFRANGYELYAIDQPQPVPAEPTVAYRAYGTVPVAAATLPPLTRKDETLVDLLHDPQMGLPAQSDFPVGPYKPKLSLTYVGQPSLLVGSSQFGTYVGGGASLYFSDILGDHNLVTGLNVQGSLKDVNALVAYQNLSHRLNWEVGIDQTPYLTGGFAEGTADVNGEAAVVDQQLTQRQTARDIYGGIAYPFSTVQRVELQAGYTNISFDNELRTQAFSLLTGNLLVDQTQNLPAGKALSLGVGSAALVYDNSFFGATSPIFGQRYRFEVSPTIGSLSYVGVLADYRRYVMPAKPFTLAARLMHYGRYGNGGEDPRLQPLYVGYPDLVRGYDFNSFDPSECQPGPGQDPNSCPVFDQLLGSRMVVGNVELRFPLLGVLGLGSGYYGAFPIELALFGDGGLAWDTTHQPSVFGSGSRDPVFSTGAALRINLLGFAVGEVDLVHPFDRPGRNWVWEFSLQPGF